MIKDFTKKELEDIVAIALLKSVPKAQRPTALQNYVQKYGGFLEKNRGKVERMLEED